MTQSSDAFTLSAGGWGARLDLGFERRNSGTVLVRNRHEGPLLVQKSLYPEGAETCHVTVLHPPGGVAAGDQLSLHATLGDRSRVLLTTPGATKWYRSEGATAHQALRFQVNADAVLEWLPRENIIFDAADVSTRLDVTLAADARYVGWEILSFGRRAAGERWSRGRLAMRTCIRRAQHLLWSEVADVDAGSRFAQSSVGLSGSTVCGTFVVAGHDIDDDLLLACRGVKAGREAARIGITRLPAVMIMRYLGNSAEAAFGWFSALWTLLRPRLTDRAACAPRVWAC